MMSIRPLLSRGLAAVAMVAAAAGPAAAQDVELYDQPEFGGVRLTLSAATPDLAAYGLAGRVASVVVRRGQWEFCTQPRYAGACIAVGPGRYGQLPPALRGSVMSMREAGKGPPPVPPRPGTPDTGGMPTAVLYSEEFGGERLVVTEATGDLRPRAFNDTAVAVEISGRQPWELCSDGGFRGSCQRFDPGRHVLPPALRNRVSSLRPAGGGSPVPPPPGSNATLVIYEHGNFGGRQLAINGTTPNFVSAGFNDVASSLEIRRGRWQLCAHIDFGEPCAIFGPGRHVLGPPLRDKVSSARPVFGSRDDPTPAGGAIALYEGFDLGGRSVLVTETTLNLRSLEFNDKARSVEIYSGRWELCGDADFRGQCIVLGPGRHALPEGLSGRVSSLRPR